MTRFEDGSELCALNAEPGESCSVSPTLAVAVDAALWAARRSDGLVDPTLVGELEDAGYASSRADLPPAGIDEALAGRPRSRAAHATGGLTLAAASPSTPSPERCQRPPGVRIDTGGSGKGLAADLAADRLGGYAAFVVDAGGDLRLGGERPLERLVRIDHPLDEPAHEFQLDSGAVATSGIKTRLWRTDEGFSHHLLEPSRATPLGPA